MRKRWIHTGSMTFRQNSGKVGREYFARRPGSEIWVWFGDLPYVVSRNLLELHVVAAVEPLPVSVSVLSVKKQGAQ